MTCEYVKEHYGVPADVGRRVVVNGKPGVIAADRGHYIGVTFDTDKPGTIRNAHPTWKVEYGEMSKTYRCGWCGSPTDENGHCLTPEHANAMAGDWDAAEQINGDCCPNGNGQAAADALRDARRSEWEREMRADAFGER